MASSIKPVIYHKLGFFMKGELIRFCLSVSINPTKYLQYLLNKFTFLGGTLERKTVFHINDCIQDGTQVVINCCGLSASTLGGVRDSKVYPVRGCTILAKFPNVLREGFIRRHHDGAMTYLIPRDDGIGCLGGTFVSVLCEFIS